MLEAWQLSESGVSEGSCDLSKATLRSALIFLSFGLVRVKFPPVPEIPLKHGCTTVLRQTVTPVIVVWSASIARAERDGTRTETRFRLSPKRTSPFKSVGASVQSTAGSRGVRISLSNAG